MAKYRYEATTDTGTALFTNGRVGDTVFGLVRRSDGVRVWTGPTLDPNARGAKGRAKARAAEMARRFEHYFKTRGRCWFDDDQNRRLEKNIDKARERARRQTLANHAFEMWRVLNRQIFDDKAFALIATLETAIAAAETEAEAEARRQHDRYIERRREKVRS